MLASAIQQCESAISKHKSPLEPPSKVFFFFIMSIIYYFSLYSMWKHSRQLFDICGNVELLSHVRLFCEPMDYSLLVFPVHGIS